MLLSHRCIPARRSISGRAPRPHVSGYQALLDMDVQTRKDVTQRSPRLDVKVDLAGVYMRLSP